MEVIDTAGNKYYLLENCQFCNLDSAGNHRFDCPDNPYRIKLIRYDSFKITYGDGIKDRQGQK